MSDFSRQSLWTWFHIFLGIVSERDYPSVLDFGLWNFLGVHLSVLLSILNFEFWILYLFFFNFFFGFFVLFYFSFFEISFSFSGHSLWARFSCLDFGLWIFVGIHLTILNFEFCILFFIFWIYFSFFILFLYIFFIFLFYFFFISF